MFYILLLIIVLLIIFIGYKPKQYWIALQNSNPPILAWVNSPKINATATERQVRLPNDATYLIPEHSAAHFILVFDWKIETVIDDVKVDLVIPAKFPTDFASIPKLLHSLISPLTNTVYAAIIHDYLYRNPQALNAKAITKQQADCVFYWAMRYRGVTQPTAGLMYWAVRLFGASSYIRR